MRQLSCCLLAFFSAALAAAEVAPAKQWAATAVAATSPVRGEMRLDGPWRFAPGSGKEAPAAGWGWIAVPGSWRDQRSLLAPAGIGSSRSAGCSYPS